MPPSTCYRRLRETLRGYISPLTVDMVLHRTLGAIGATPETLSCSQLDVVVETAMVSLRMFVAEGKLPDLMLDLAALVEGEGGSTLGFGT